MFNHIAYFSGDYSKLGRFCCQNTQKENLCDTEAGFLQADCPSISQSAM